MASPGALPLEARPDEDPGARVVVRGSMWLAASIAMQGLSGYLFWLVAARLYESDEVGHASALFSSALFVSYVTSLGLTVTAARYCSDRSRADVVFSWSVVSTAVATAAGTAAYLAIVSADTVDVIRAWGTLAAFGVFFLVVVGTSMAALTDIRLAAARRWPWVFVRVVAMSVVRLALLPLFVGAADRELWLFLLGGGTAAVSGLVVVALIPRAVGGGWRLRPLPSGLDEIVRFSLVNYGADLAARAPLFVLPVIVLTNVGATANANFYVAFSIIVLVFTVPMMVGQVVLIEGGRAVHQAAAQARLALVLTLGLMVVASASTWLLSDLVVSVYGADYDEAADILPLLMLAGVPWALTSITLAELRVRASHLGTGAVTGVFAAGVLVPALVLVPRDGLDGAVTAWLVGNVAAALVGTVAARLSRRGGTVPAAGTNRVDLERKEEMHPAVTGADLSA